MGRRYLGRRWNRQRVRQNRCGNNGFQRETELRFHVDVFSEKEPVRYSYRSTVFEPWKRTRDARTALLDCTCRLQNFRSRSRSWLPLGGQSREERFYRCARWDSLLALEN